MEVFPSHYFPSIRYMAAWLKSENPTLDFNENFQKQTYRNRCYILGPNGRQLLVVPVLRKGDRQMKDMQISYAEDWQKQHYKSLESAYRRSPYFEYYEDLFMNLFEQKEKYLVDLNTKILERILSILQKDFVPLYTQSYQSNYIADYREEFIAKQEPVSIPPYTQVFAEKMDFESDLSIFDLICNIGPESATYIKNKII